MERLEEYERDKSVPQNRPQVVFDVGEIKLHNNLFNLHHLRLNGTVSLQHSGTLWKHGRRWCGSTQRRHCSNNC